MTVDIKVAAVLDNRGFVFRIGERVKIAVCPQNHPTAAQFVGKIGQVDMVELSITSFVSDLFEQFAYQPEKIKCYMRLEDGQKVAFDARALEPVDLLMSKIIKLSNPTDYWSQNHQSGDEAFRVYIARHGDKHPDDYMDQPDDKWTRKAVNFQKHKIIIDCNSKHGFVSYMNPNEWPRFKTFKFSQTVKDSDRVQVLGRNGIVADCVGCVEDSKGGAYVLIMFNKFTYEKAGK